VKLGANRDRAVAVPAATASARRVVLGLFFASLLVAVPLAAVRVAFRLREAAAAMGEDARGARARKLGADAVAAYDRIRRAVPEDGAYLLLDGGEEWEGATYWVRFELAPRRARFAGRLSELAATPGWTLPPGPRWVVVALPGRPPLLLAREDLVARLARMHGRR
jgi:hypothetical protein